MQISSQEPIHDKTQTEVLLRPLQATRLLAFDGVAVVECVGLSQSNTSSERLGILVPHIKLFAD